MNAGEISCESWRAALAQLLRRAQCVCLCLAMTLAPAAGQQQGSPPAPAPDLAVQNYSRVAASVAAIREVLLKDAGLMVELKRWVAKEATDRGQLVEDNDLTDQAIFNRVAEDLEFRGVATRLLQRYGYLIPALNPGSDLAKENELVRQERAQRLARAQARAEQEQDEEIRGSRAGASPELPAWRAEKAAENQRAASRRVTDSSPPPDPAAPGTLRAPVPLAPQIPERNPLENPQIPSRQMVQTAALATNPSPAHPAAAEPGSDPAAEQDRAALLRDAQNRDALSRDAMASSRAGWPPERREASLVPAAAAKGNASHAARPPEEFIARSNPFADVPSLYEMYQQASPRSNATERFGMEVFRNGTRNSEMLPMDLPVGPDYVVGPGDGLAIDVWGAVSQRVLRTVDQEGRVALPEVGPVLVSGRTLGEVQSAVQKLLQTQFRDVSADVSLSRLRTIRVYVVGDVDSPGAYDVSSLSTPLNALFAAGGPTASGSIRILKHYRGKQLVQEVDVYDLLLRGVRSDLRRLENGDTLLVPPIGPGVRVEGAVRRPALYELRKEKSLAEVLALAGGILPTAALRKIQVQRVEAHSKRTMLSFDLAEANGQDSLAAQLEAFAIRDGDEVRIFPIAPFTQDAIYLQGHVLRPGRYSWRPGMKLTDIVSSYADLLPEPATKYAEIIRLNSPDYRPSVESINLEAALNPVTSPALKPLDTVRIFSRYDFENVPTVHVSGEVRHPGLYRATGQIHLRDAVHLAGGVTPDALLDNAQVFRIQADSKLKIMSVNLSEALAGNPMDNILLQPRDRLLIHRNPARVDPASVNVRGEVAKPGRYPLSENMRIADLLKVAGGFKRSADAQTADLTRYQPGAASGTAAEHIEVNIAAALSGDAAHNIEMRDGDTLTIRQLPGWKDIGAAVTLAGEAVHPGVYGIRPGERLSSLLRRAGGFLATAYPQGALLERNSVRELQEKSRQELIQRIEQDLGSVRTALSDTPQEQAALQQAALQQRQRVLESLRATPVTGRLVIRLHSNLAEFEKSPYDIELRDGDQLFIPKRPNFVLVTGQVYNSNAVTFVPRKSAGWYLQQAGGPTGLANKNDIFVVRANGEVVSRSNTGWWGGGVLSVQLEPGDTLVVPEKPLGGSTFWKNFLAVAQLIQGGAIAAAVVVRR
jgi:protein involved in polysaccharide export with SLBB domain